ncbi:hypothetical protein FSP39_009647 [Pinctada imbricata]|uniref:Uncharacterized protein n=1 Tax=Pinctada imbricata TaxID=66713 RepID=A0AA88XW41_PINIB|nr:hypothetical protein FSP39_009647 [Pinctada imbricata]
MYLYDYDFQGCPVGKYGSECTKNCSSFCINRICDPDSGACKYGCRESWFNQSCSHTSMSDLIMINIPYCVYLSIFL